MWRLEKSPGQIFQRPHVRAPLTSSSALGPAGDSNRRSDLGTAGGPQSDTERSASAVGRAGTGGLALVTLGCLCTCPWPLTASVWLGTIRSAPHTCAARAPRGARTWPWGRQLAGAAAGGQAPDTWGDASGGAPPNLTQPRLSTEPVSGPPAQELRDRRLRGVRASGSTRPGALTSHTPEGAGVPCCAPKPCMPRAAPDPPGHPCRRDAEGTCRPCEPLAPQGRPRAAAGPPPPAATPASEVDSASPDAGVMSACWWQ